VSFGLKGLFYCFVSLFQSLGRPCCNLVEPQSNMDAARKASKRSLICARHYARPRLCCILVVTKFKGNFVMFTGYV
jgi:hypothetical protein